MKVPFTQKTLQDWAGPTVFHDAQRLWERGGVVTAELDEDRVRGTVKVGTRELRTSVRVCRDGSAENQCPCYDNRERGLICSHVIALALDVLRQSYDPDRERRRIEEQRKAARIAQLDEADFMTRVPSGTPGSMEARLVLALDAGWRDQLPAGTVGIHVRIRVGGKDIPAGDLDTEPVYGFSTADDAILFVIEDICEGPVRSRIEIGMTDFVNLLDLAQGVVLLEADRPDPFTVNAAKVSSRILIDLDRETGEVLVMVRTELPYLKPGELPVYAVSPRGGYALGAGNVWPLEKLLPVPLHGVYQDAVAIPRPAVPRFFEAELPMLEAELPVDTDLSLDLFTIEPASPRMLLHIKGSPAALAGTLYAEYGTLAVVVGKPSPGGPFSHPDPEDLLRYTVRNPTAEARALGVLNEAGFHGAAGDDLSAITGTREVLNFLGRELPELRRRGWRIEVEGRIAKELDGMEFATPIVKVDEPAEGGWFDVQFDYEDGRGASLSGAEIQRALRRGDSYVESNGRTVLIDERAIQSMNHVFSDCSSGEGRAPGSFRLSTVHGAYVKSSLDALDGVDVEASPTWQVRSEQRNRTLKVEPVPLPEAVHATLRPYQHDGLNWLTFLERNGFCGILADEMGLGKTLQTLCWLCRERTHPDAAGCPALVICPTSLVENWAEEAARFVPGLRVLVISGANRKPLWKKIPDADLVITSYALMRRDLDQYLQHHFSAIILDEAQHIKNHSTQNAKAAKQLRATNRFVLTGTPLENSVSDLWSIMDFLMPGYLGGHKQFRERYEIPIGRADRDGEDAQARLRRKLHPFLLRRLKKDVARDLPPKIQRVAKFTMSNDQQAVYKEYLEASQRRLLSMVSSQGFNRSRMEIFKTLLRLRQVCCHLDLLKLPDLNAKQPSAKMELFFELLDEAIDGGHRVLVFSQFVGMLTLLRKEMEKRGLTYCYLDGSTKKRMEEVRRFNTDRTVPVFLISLKAGGTGLNLTGADMVIHFDPWWNPAVEDQATDRAYRIGQKRTVYSVKLIARDSVEEKVLALQQKKQAVINATLASDEQVMEQLDWEDVQELLSL